MWIRVWFYCSRVPTAKLRLLNFLKESWTNVKSQSSERRFAYEWEENTEISRNGNNPSRRFSSVPLLHLVMERASYHLVRQTKRWLRPILSNTVLILLWTLISGAIYSSSPPLINKTMSRPPWTCTPSMPRFSISMVTNHRHTSILSSTWMFV